MTTRKKYDEHEVIFYCTITCFDLIPLFAITNFYDAVYNWFDELKKLNNRINGYVIMPNHLHVLIRVDEESPTINKLVANGKRFMAYEMVKRLKESGRFDLLMKMEQAVPKEQAKIGKLHQVFEQSFDCKPCYTKKFMEQKLDYIHHNPSAKKWNLANEFTDYKHSSAAFYKFNMQGVYVVDDVTEIEW